MTLMAPQQIASFIIFMLAFFLAAFVLYTLLNLAVLLAVKIFRRKIRIKKNFKKILKANALFALIAVAIGSFLILRVLFNIPEFTPSEDSEGFSKIGSALGFGIAVAVLMGVQIIFLTALSIIFMMAVSLIYLIICIIRKKYD